MAFDRLPPQEPFRMPEARNYSASILSMSREAALSTRCILDVAYGDDYWQRVDIYLPKDASLTGLPVMLYLHGGGWQRGYKEDMGFMAPAVVDMNAIFVSVSYRLAPTYKWDDQLDDVLEAIALVHRSIADLGGDPNKIVIGGHSAGGHLSAMAALRSDLLEAKGLPATVIKHCLPVSGAFAFDADLDPEFSNVICRDAADIAAASALNHVRAGAPPFYITWSEKDLGNMLRTTAPMIERLNEAGVPCEIHMFEGFDHFDISLAHADADGIWMRKARQILAGL